jgi:tRNA threonylcarbamoyladenosine biosynthesis protein TsaE
MLTSGSAAETEAAGARLAENLQVGDVVALVGELGAGKTQFVKGIARGLGVADTVTSPTFTLIHEYRGGRLSLYHFDFYRLDQAGALTTIGFDEYLSGDGVCVIEWADKFASVIPAQAHWVRLRIISPEVRAIDCS